MEDALGEEQTPGPENGSTCASPGTPALSGSAEASPRTDLEVSGRMGPKQMRAILMRLDGRSNRQVASALGMSVHSINAWWKRPDMKREYVFQRAHVASPLAASGRGF